MWASASAPLLCEPPRPALNRRPPLAGVGGSSRNRAPPASRGTHHGHSEVRLFLQHHLSHPYQPLPKSPQSNTPPEKHRPCVFFTMSPAPRTVHSKNCCFFFFSLLWLRLCTSNAGAMGLIPSPRIKIPQAVRHGQKSKK